MGSSDTLPECEQVSVLFAPPSNVKGREGSREVTGLTPRLTPHTSADKTSDNSGGASGDEMENIMQREG